MDRGEDTDMFLRVKDVGKKVVFNPGVKILHKVRADRISTQNIIKRAFDGGVSVSVMSKVRTYDISNSAENSYLKKLIFDFYPKRLKMLTSKPFESIKQMTVVTLVIIAESIGYLSGMLWMKKR